MKVKEVGLYFVALAAFVASALAHFWMVAGFTYPYIDYAVPLAMAGMALLVVALFVRRSSAKG